MSGSLFEKYFFDAMANLGNSLGQRTADNAARRQGIKARNAIDEMLGGVTETDVMSAISGMPGQQFDLKKNTIVDPNFSLSNATPDGKSVQENAVAEALDLKRMGQYPVGATGNVLQQVRNSADKSDWQAPTISIEDVKMALRKKGVDEDIIEKELSYYNSKIKERANATLTPQIFDKFNKGDYTGALQDTLRLKQYDPETANVLLSGSVTPRDLYASGQESAKYDRNRNDKMSDRDQQHAWDLEAEGRKINNAKDMALFNAKLTREAANWSIEDKVAFAQRNPEYASVVLGKSAAGGGKDIFESGAFKAAKDQITALDEKVSLGGELTPEEKQRYAQSNAIMNSAFDGFFQPTNQQQEGQVDENLSDYPTAVRFATKIKEGAAGKFSNEQVAQAIRKNYGLAANDNSNPFVEKILSDTGIISSASDQHEQVPQQQEPQKKPWYDRTERTGIAALTPEDIKKALMENVRNNPVEYRR